MNFKYDDKVKVIGGFFRQLRGTVIDYRYGLGGWQYQVMGGLNNMVVKWVNESDLESDNDTLA